MEERIYLNLLDDVALDLCFEMHAQISLYGLSLEEIYNVEPIERQIDTPVVEQDSVFVSCLQCKRQVHASRYTNHLEKCLTGSRRMITPKQRQDVAREIERKQLQVLSKPQLYRDEVPRKNAMIELKQLITWQIAVIELEVKHSLRRGDPRLAALFSAFAYN
ncbi:unnamed protein product [Peronospora destructor]|uniref:SAGA-associated factor 11 n=1 Tax=Peronospora destructor TaxID=86335 RepID=A0AAV0VCE4_9STRA|nr:unnamed protein product [Peronospora destructor]